MSTVRFLVQTTVLVALLACCALGQSSPKEVAGTFYSSYHEATSNQSKRDLILRHKDLIESALADRLLKGFTPPAKPDPMAPRMDWDIFFGGQWNPEKYWLGEPSYKAGLAYVPVHGTNDSTGDRSVAKLRSRVVLRQHKTGWKIANVVYPAVGRHPGWDALSRLKEMYP